MLFGERLLGMRLYEVQVLTGNMVQHMAISHLAQDLPVPGARMEAVYCASCETEQR